MGIYSETRRHNGTEYDVYLSNNGYLFVIPQVYVSVVFTDYDECISFADRFIELL